MKNKDIFSSRDFGITSDRMNESALNHYIPRDRKYIKGLLRHFLPKSSVLVGCNQHSNRLIVYVGNE